MTNNKNTYLSLYQHIKNFLTDTFCKNWNVQVEFQSIEEFIAFQKKTRIHTYRRFCYPEGTIVGYFSIKHRFIDNFINSVYDFNENLLVTCEKSIF